MNPHTPCISTTITIVLRRPSTFQLVANIPRACGNQYHTVQIYEEPVEMNIYSANIPRVCGNEDQTVKRYQEPVEMNIKQCKVYQDPVEMNITQCNYIKSL